MTIWIAWNFTLSYSFQPVHFLQYGLLLCTQRAITGHFLEVSLQGLTLKHCSSLPDLIAGRTRYESVNYGISNY